MTSIKVFTFVLASILGFQLQVLAQKKLQAGKSTHKITLEAGGQSMPMSSTKSIEEKDGNWVIYQTLMSGMGEMKDEFIIAKTDLSPIAEKLSEGPAKVHVSFSDKEVKGSIAVNGKNHTIAHTLKNSILANGAATFESLTHLPLKVGYKKTYYVYDIQAKKERAYTIKVMAEETVAVEAGKFKTLKCQITPADDTEFTTLFSGPARVWLSMETGTASLIKYTSNIPQGTIAMELSE